MTDATALKFGKLPYEDDTRTLMMKSYLTPAMPPPPAAVDRLGLVANFPMFGNDQYGDCAAAALAHMVQVYAALTSRHDPQTSLAYVERLYFRLTGGPDSGLVMLEVLRYWRKHFFDGERLYAFARIDADNDDQIRQAVVLFGGAYLGFRVPPNCQPDFFAGRTWDAGPPPVPNQGHAVNVLDYNAIGPRVVTWAKVQQCTWAWAHQYCDEAWAPLPLAARRSGFSAGFDFDQLAADLAALGSVQP